MTVAVPHENRSSRARLFDTVERIAVLALYSALVWRFIGSLSETPANAIFIASEGLIALMVLLRRSTDQISLRPVDWLTGAAGAFLPMLVVPAHGGWSGGAILLLTGFLISVGAKLSLRRSFGLVAANRGVKTGGLYALVRHPMYMGYAIAYAGTLMLNPSLWNAALIAAWLAFQVVRIFAEERVLMQDDGYRAHAQKVKFRLIPGVW